MPRFLTADEVELRIASTSPDKKKCQILIYKDARTDMALLDEMFGSSGWQCDYKEIKSNMYCGIGVRNDKGEWVWRWNCGVESKGTGDDDENNKKGEASDAFKRAGFLWGIGRELYQWKNISIKMNDNDFWTTPQGKSVLTTKFIVQKIEYTPKGDPLHLVIVDDDLNIRYEYGKSTPAPKPQNTIEPPKSPATTIITPITVNDKPETPKIVAKPNLTIEQITERNKRIYGEMLNVVYEILFKGNMPSADTRAKTIVKEYFARNIKAPFADIELSDDATQKQPSVKGKILVMKDEILEGKNNYESLIHSADQEITIYEMEKGKAK